MKGLSDCTLCGGTGEARDRDTGEVMGACRMPKVTVIDRTPRWFVPAGEEIRRGKLLVSIERSPLDRLQVMPQTFGDAPLAKRIAAALQACEGIEDPAELRALYDEAIEALKRVHADFGEACDCPSARHRMHCCWFDAEALIPVAADHGPHSGDGALAVQEVHEAPKAEQCTLCGQRDTGQTGEYPCVECGLPTDHDRPRCTGQHPNCLGCDALRRKRDLAKKPPGSCL